MILVSACLAGLAVAHDGEHRACKAVEELTRGRLALPVCPEQLGGLATPRRPAEIPGGDGSAVWQGEAPVLTDRGQDVTAAFLRGATETVKLARLVRCRFAILKARSPSCATGDIYDGSFRGGVVPGYGVTAWHLKSWGIRVWSEEELAPHLISWLRRETSTTRRD